MYTVKMDDIIKVYNSLQPRSEIELEARVCFSYNDYGKIVSNTNVYEFKAIMNKLKPDDKYSETIECHELGRKIIKTGREPIIQKKDNVFTHVENTRHRFLKIKWSLNTERVLDPTTDLGELKYIRKKNVHVYKVHLNWNMFLIEAYSKTTRLKTYEIELERSCNDTLINLNEIWLVNDLIYNLFKNRREFNIVKQFNSLVTTKYLHTVFWPINKPINLKFNMWDKIRYNYYYYPKLDGERFLLFTLHSCLYIFNDTSQIYVKENKMFPSNCVIDCEYMKDTDTYHVFDTLFWGGRDVRGENLCTRYGYLEGSVFPPYIKLIPLYKQFDNKLWEIVQESTSLSDGIIFTPRYEPYKNNCTYKYKPPELLTIDFMIDVDNKLYVVDNGSNYVLFEGTVDNPYQQGNVTYNFEYQLYDILEFHYDTSLKNFVPLKVRHDKVRPNNISVALDVWYDIHNPIDVVSFIQNIS